MILVGEKNSGMFFFEKGRDLNVGAGCPPLIERIESGLLSLEQMRLTKLHHLNGT
ncbi:MAG: hypothetical protein Ct9H300mP28_29370 [Pseudomonadota bacterium]|nr:MAG: hypothetical protein Ct9H300mP28_29370 [Pseudomonadota bacterium]